MRFESEMELRFSASNSNLSSYADHFFHYQSRPTHLLAVESSSSTKWSPEENKLFENALALFYKDSPDKWEKVAAMIPGKNVLDVMKQHQELEADVSRIKAGLVPLTPRCRAGYTSTTYPPAPFTLDYRVAGGEQMSSSCSSYDGDHGFGVLVNNTGGSSSSRRRLASLKTGSEQDRKKGVLWTEQEHKLFLLGLRQYGKGDWRNISRNFVISRTPTQVANHTQKYFMRQKTGGKDKRRASIHDITIVNLNNTRTHSPPDRLENGQQHSPPPGMSFQWNKSFKDSGGASMDFNNAYGSNSNKAGHGMHSGGSGMLDSYIGSQSFSASQIQSGMHYPHV